MEKLQNLLLLLTDDVINMESMVKTRLISVDAIDALVDIDIIKDYKSKLIADIIELNHQAQKDPINLGNVKRSLHNLMCFYSEYVDRCISLVRTFSKDKDNDFTNKINMSSINALLFSVLQDVRKKEKLSDVIKGKTKKASLETKDGCDIESIVLV